DGAHQREIGLAAIPECEKNEIELPVADQRLDIDDGAFAVRPRRIKRIGRNALLLKNPRIAFTSRCILGGKTHAPAGGLQEFDQVVRSPRTALTVELRHSGSADECAFSCPVCKARVKRLWLIFQNVTPLLREFRLIHFLVTFHAGGQIGSAGGSFEMNYDAFGLVIDSMAL